MPPHLCVYDPPDVRRRETAQERTYFPIEANYRDFSAVAPKLAPDPPRQSVAAGTTRRAKAQRAFFFHRARPWGDEFAVWRNGRLFQTGPLADTGGGHEQPVMAGGDNGDRRNVNRRPAQPFGNRSGANLLI